MKQLLILISFFLLTGFTTPELERALEYLEEVAHNGGHGLTVYDPAKFDLDKELVNVYEEGLNNSCRSPLTIVIQDWFDVPYKDSYARKALKDFNKWIDEYGSDMEVDPVKIKKTLHDLIRSDENKTVIYSGYNRHSIDPSESCYYQRYYIYRKDGILIQLNFEHTD
jgi:hypothetical protein